MLRLTSANIPIAHKSFKCTVAMLVRARQICYKMFKIKVNVQ